MGQRSLRKGGLFGISETGQVLKQLSFGWVSAHAVPVVSIWNITSAWGLLRKALCVLMCREPLQVMPLTISYMNASWVQDDQGLWQ